MNVWRAGMAGVCSLALIPLPFVAGWQGKTGIDQGPNLHVSSSDNALEKQIGEYFESVKKWKIDYDIVGTNADDLLVLVSFSCGETIPSIRMSVDNLVSATSPNDPTHATESRIKVMAAFRYGILPDHPLRARVLEAINQFQMENWAPDRVMLDKDGDLLLVSSVNISGEKITVHAELVADAVERMVLGWQVFHDILADHGLPLPART